jgi:hypothetical protein
VGLKDGVLGPVPKVKCAEPAPVGVNRQPAAVLVGDYCPTK